MPSQPCDISSLSSTDTYLALQSSKQGYPRNRIRRIVEPAISGLRASAFYSCISHLHLFHRVDFVPLLHPESYRMEPGISHSPPSRGQQFSTSLFSISNTVPSLSRPLTPALLLGEALVLQSPSQPASPIFHHGDNFTPYSTHKLSPAMENCFLQPKNPYNESMLTPHKAGYDNSPFGTNGFPSAKTTPSFDPEDDLEMPAWAEDETLSLFPQLGASVLEEEGSGGLTRGADTVDEYPVASPTATTIDPTSPLAALQRADLAYIKKLADDNEPIIARIQRTGTDESTASWVASPTVRVEDTENSGVNLAFSIDSFSMDPSNTRGTGSAQILTPPSSSLRVERRPRSQSDVGIKRIERDNEGVWCGLSPEMRTGLGDSDMPMNLKEMDQSKKIHEKNLEVEAWLKRSPMLGPEKMNCRGLTVPKMDRRSKSISDFRLEPSDVQLQHEIIGDVDMAEDTDSDEDVSARNSSWEEGSLDAWGEFAEKSNTTNPSPPANLEVSIGPEPEEYDPDKDPKFLPAPGCFFSAKPWCDAPNFESGSTGVNQPPTSNLAIHRFKERADNIETASRTATFGSATMQGLTLEDAFLNPGILKRLSLGRDKGKGKEKEKENEKEKLLKERKASIFENFEFPFKKRTSTNNMQGGLPESAVGEISQQDITSNAASSPPKWKSSWSQRKSKLSIDTAIGQATGQLAAIGAAEESKSATSVGSPWSPFGLNSLSPQGTKRTRRTRSKSDLSNVGSTSNTKLTKPRPVTKPEVGLVALMQQQDRKSTRLNSSHITPSRMPSSA